MASLNAHGNDVFVVCYDVGHANISGQDPAGMIIETKWESLTEYLFAQI